MGAIPSVVAVKKDSTMEERMRYVLIPLLKEIAESDKTRVSENAGISMQEIISDLNDESKKVCILSHRIIPIS